VSVLVEEDGDGFDIPSGEIDKFEVVASEIFLLSTHTNSQ